MNSPSTIDRVTLEETVTSVEAAFPYRAEICHLETLPYRACPWHWHGGVECFCLLTGSLTYHLPGKTCSFEAGDVGFINAGILHMTSSEGSGPCCLMLHIFSPALVSGFPGSLIEQKYIHPLLCNDSADIIRIPASDPDAPALRSLMEAAYSLFEERTPGSEIFIQNHMSRLWFTMFQHAPQELPYTGSRDASRIKAMINCIQSSYTEPLTLEEIASQAQIGTREACRCFKRNLGMTIFQYIIRLRIDHAGQLLQSTCLPITEIATRSGFSSPSYFGRQFQLYMHVTPSEYRKNMNSTALPENDLL